MPKRFYAMMYFERIAVGDWFVRDRSLFIKTALCPQTQTNATNLNTGVRAYFVDHTGIDQHYSPTKKRQSIDLHKVKYA